MPFDMSPWEGSRGWILFFRVRTAIELIAVLVNLENNRIPICKIGVQFYHNVINYGIDIVNH